MCKKERGQNGIKFMGGNELRLKINSGSRLAGTLEKSGDRRYCIFTKREKHDDYKRR